MAPALKAKRVKKTTKRSSISTANEKPKWEKPIKSISAQSGVTKIKKVNKRSFDPIKAKRGVVLLKNIPHGFYENEMRQYFAQFGDVTRIRLARSQRTGRSKGFAYIEFKVPEVAQIAAQTMDNYIMYQHRLTTAYIPPEKQTYNFFRKDVTFMTNASGETTFTSPLIESREKAIDNINRVATDEEHAKRMKRSQKTLQKQQKKYGVDLANILVSGNSSSSDAAPMAEVKAKDGKKKATVAKKAEKKPVMKRDDSKIATKKDKKKVASPASSSSNGGESLLSGLLNETYQTDTSDDDFKIDHSFSGDSDDSSASGSQGLAALLVKKMRKNQKLANSSFSASVSEDDEESDDDIETDDDVESDDEDDFEINDESADDEESEDDEETQDVGEWEDDSESDDDGNSMEFEDESELDDDESEDDEPEILSMISKNKKKLAKGATPNDVKAKTNLKRKLKDDSSSTSGGLSTTSSQLESDTVAKKQKQNPNKKKNVPSLSKASIPVPESSKVVVNKKNQKAGRPEKNQWNTTTSSSEPESLPPQTKHKKIKLASQVEITSKLPQKLDTKKPQMKEKKLKQNFSMESTLSSPIPNTTSSETEIPKQKLNKRKKKSKLNAGSESKPENVIVPAKKETPEGLPLKSKTEKKKNQQATVEPSNVNLKTASAELEVPKSKKKNLPAKDIPKAAVSKLAEPEVQISKKKNQPAKGSPKTAVAKLAEPEVPKSKKKNPPAKDSPKTAAAKLVEPETQKSKKKNQPAKDEQTNFSPKTPASTSSESEAQKPKNKQKTVANGGSTVSKPEPEKIDKKKKKVKPVTSSLISENGLAKKSIKAQNPKKLKASSAAWSTVSETDVDEAKKPKAKGIAANLKTIVHKTNSKKKNGSAKPLDAKKVKQTPDELLKLITSKDLKQKSKKKLK